MRTPSDLFFDGTLDYARLDGKPIELDPVGEIDGSPPRGEPHGVYEFTADRKSYRVEYRFAKGRDRVVDI